MSAATGKISHRALRARPGRVQLVEIEVLASEAGVHPDVARRFLRLGLLESVGTAASPRFPRDAAARLARAVRLRRDLGLNYAGALFASELLDRIEELEERLGHYERPTRPQR